MIMTGKDILKSAFWAGGVVVKGVFRLGNCNIFWQSVAGLWASNWESTATDGWLLDRWHQKTIGACRTKRPSAGKTAYWHERSKLRRCTSVKNSERQQGDPIAYSIQSEMYNQWTNSSVMGPAEVQYEMQKIKYLLQQNAATDAQCDNA